MEILREVSNIGGDDIPVVEPITAEKVLDSFHVTEKDLKRAIGKTNVMDIMRQAKENGWTMKITEDEIALYKNGKRIDGNGKNFISVEEPSGKKMRNTEGVGLIMGNKKSKVKSKSIKRK